MATPVQDYFFHRVESARDWIIQFFQEHPLFQEAVLDHYTPYSANSVDIRLRLNSETYADCFYMYESDKERLVAHIPDVKSSLGYSTGFFLFHLQLVIAAVAGVSEITLENNTNEPQRAQKGIYQLFELNTRTMSKEKRAKMTAHERAVMPEMFHQVKRTSLGRIQRVLLGRITAVLRENGAMEVWRPDAVDHLTLLFRKLRQQFNLYSGGATRRIRRGNRHKRSGSGNRRTMGRKRHHG
jgi:hypothetical protein